MTSNRKVYIMRHGERVDFNFHNWIECFDEQGNYERKDLNMPLALPKRVNTTTSWDGDSPITTMGMHQARLTGEALLQANAQIDHVYCSSAFRCIQTCAAVLEGLQLQDKLKMKVEPALFEWMYFYGQTKEPHFMTRDELIAANYNIDPDYKTMLSLEHLVTLNKESVEELYARNHNIISKILKETSGNILLVGHGMTLDSCSRLLMGSTARNIPELFQLIQLIPFCAVAAVEQTAAGTWQLVSPGCLPLTHARNKHFEWHQLLLNDWPAPSGGLSTDFPPKIREWAAKNPHIAEEMRAKLKLGATKTTTTTTTTK